MGMFCMLKLAIILVSFSKSSLPSYQKRQSSLSIDFVLLILLYFIDFFPPNITLYSWSIYNKKAKKYNF